jgi:protein-disulfide isomerase
MITRRTIIQALAVTAGAAVLPPLTGWSRSFAGVGEKPGDMAIGSPDAPITVIEFFSLTCPHCQSFHLKVYPGLKQDYVDTGKVRFVARDFPLNRPALHAAMLARCAGPERYFAFIDTLFQTFDDWTRSSDYLKKLAQIGELGGVSRDQFEACLKDSALEDSVFQAIQDAQAEYDISSTPTLIVNGRKYEDSMSLTAFSQHLDRLLSDS